MTDCPGACDLPGDPVWCRPCQARIRRQLPQLDDLAGLRALHADGHREPAITPGRRGSCDGSPSPSADDSDELTRWALDWEASYRKERHMPGLPRRDGYLADIRTLSLGFLCDHLSGVLEECFAADFGLEVLERHRQLRGAAKADYRPETKLIPCPECKMRLLVWEAGDDWMVCGGCGAQVEWDEYQAVLDKLSSRHLERTG